MKIHVGADSGYIEFDEGQNGWTEKNISFILTQLESLPLWNEIKYVKGSGVGAPYYDLPATRHKLVTLLLNDPDSSCFSKVSSDEEDLNLIDITVGRVGGYIRIVFNFSTKLAVFGLLVEHVKEILLNLYTYFSEVATLEPIMGVYTCSVLYQRPLRPTADHYWCNNNLVDIGIDSFWDDKTAPYQYENYKRIKTLPLPSIARRTHKNGILIIEWGDDWADEQKISKALEIREHWLFNNLDIRQFDFRFNELGDRWDNGISLGRTIDSDPDITLYSIKSQEAYKSAVLNPRNKELDIALIDLIKNWKINSQSDAGTPIASIYLLLPDRDSALHVSEKYTDLADAVLYLDHQDKLWEVNPSRFIN